MSRQPIALEQVGGKGNRQRVWEAIRIHGMAHTTFTAEAISRSTRTSPDLVRNYLKGLCAAEYLSCERATRPGQINVYALVRDNGAEAPRVRADGSPVTQGLKQEQMWRVLRMLAGGDTNARELAAHASTAAHPVAESAARDYLRQLAGAKYLAVTQPGKGTGRGGVQARYRLVSNTGPRPPMVTRVDGLYDPNLGVLVWVQPVTEEDCLYGR